MVRKTIIITCCAVGVLLTGAAQSADWNFQFGFRMDADDLTDVSEALADADGVTRLPPLIAILNGKVVGAVAGPVKIAGAPENSELALVHPYCQRLTPYRFAIGAEGLEQVYAWGAQEGDPSVIVNTRERGGNLNVTLDPAPYRALFDDLATRSEIAQQLVSGGSISAAASEAISEGESYTLPENAGDCGFTTDSETTLGGSLAASLAASTVVVEVSGSIVSDSYDVAVDSSGSSASPGDAPDTYEMSPADLNRARIVDSNGEEVCSFTDTGSPSGRDDDGRAVYDFPCDP